MTRDVATRGAITLVALAGILPTAANAAELESGFYRLHNHPDGAIRQPLYGLRLDGLSGNDADDFTFDFDHENSAVWLLLTDTGPNSYSIEISGQSWGGRDVGSSYAVDEWVGIYDFSFTYNVGVQDVPGDDDIWVVASSGSNSGLIEAPNGNLYLLEDKSNGSYNFRLGDENNDSGHRGFDGISGWGWLMHGLISPQLQGGTEHVVSSDWLFTAEKTDTPTPGAISLLAGAIGITGVRRRRSTR